MQVRHLGDTRQSDWVSRVCRSAIGILFVNLSGATAVAAVTSVQSQVVPQLVVPGFTTNDLLIDFTGNLRGQQMILSLTQGSIYQDGFGSTTAPSIALSPVFPSVLLDTFVTIGGRWYDGPTPPASHPVLVVGGAVNLQPGSSLKFDTKGLNIAWAPGTGVDVPSGTDFITARITLSNDAQGILHYFGSTGAGTGEPLLQTLPVSHGCICFVDGAPRVNDFTYTTISPNEVVQTTLTADFGVDSWSDLLLPTYTPPFGSPPGLAGANIPPTWDPATQLFRWDTTGSTLGTYTWTVDATNGFGTSTGDDRGLITIQINVPEPRSIVLLAGVVAVSTLHRRRANGRL